MNQTREWKTPGFQKVVSCENAKVGLKAIIAVHNTNRGPSCGGIRLLPYASFEEALNDVLRLSKGMSYKSALAELGFGGGKAVVILDPAKKSPDLFRAFGDFVESFQGSYIAAKDMNIESSDLAVVKEKTQHVLGIEGLPGSSGDPSPVTARGVFHALKATAEEALGADSLKGVRVAFQGLGAVGFAVAQLAKEAGAELVVTDINASVVKRAEEELGAKSVSLDGIYDSVCDIFSPCARGAILNAGTIPRLKCKAVVGGANNQLATPQDGMRLHERGILYAPDFAVNAGGIINIFVELGGYDRGRALQLAENIYHTVKQIFAQSRAKKSPPFVIAEQMAEERLNV
jgi:leucine dehydrogenase